MDSEILYQELAHLMKSHGSRMLLYRGEDELRLLYRWLNQTAAPADEVNKSEAAIREIIEKCGKCGEIDEKKFGVGIGSNGVMIILNPPRMVSRVEKQYLKNESIELLKKIISAAELEFNECYITTLVKCEVHDPLLKPSRVVANCDYILSLEISRIKPVIIIVFGDIIPLQKIVKESQGIDWYNLEHPMTLIKNPELKKGAWNTLKLIMARMKELAIT